METVNVAGRRIEALFLPGVRTTAPVLVFLHEGLGSVAAWRDFPQELVERTGCSALIYSRYGNGFSEALGAKREVTYMHEEARETLPGLLDAFGIRAAIAIGHSDGASIALIAAGEGDVRLRGVVAQAPHVFVEDISVEAIVRAKFAYEQSDLRSKLERYHDDVDRTFYGWNDIWLDPEFRTWDIRESVRGIRVPLLLVQGENDEYGTIAQVRTVREEASHSAVDALYLAHCAHSPHRDRPELVAAAIAGFVKNVAP